MTLSSKRVARALALGLAMLPAAANAAEPPCGCWYRGYEDGLEFGWDNRHTAESFGFCQKSGRTTQYDAGFKTGSERAARECPYLPRRPKGAGGTAGLSDALRPSGAAAPTAPRASGVPAP